MGLFDFGKKKEPTAYDKMVERERATVGKSLMAEQAKFRGRELAKGDAEKARFAALDRGERAKERIGKARSVLQKVGGGLSAAGEKFEAAGKRYDARAKQMSGGGSSMPAYLKTSGGSSMPAYLRPAVEKKAARRKSVTIRFD